MLRYSIVNTELGYIGFALSSVGLKRVTLPQQERETAERILHGDLKESLTYDPEGLAELEARFQAFGQGKDDLVDLPLDLGGMTPFQCKVSQLVHDIPQGQVETYGSVAALVGSPKGARAVGAVMAQNPLCLVVPCHRVVAGDGSLHGFGGGLPQKAQLLRMEGVKIFEQAASGGRRYCVEGRK
jgi:O-6-methylguanine DNA methyltransferase